MLHKEEGGAGDINVALLLPSKTRHRPRWIYWADSTQQGSTYSEGELPQLVRTAFYNTHMTVSLIQALAVSTYTTRGKRQEKNAVTCMQLTRRSASYIKQEKKCHHKHQRKKYIVPHLTPLIKTKNSARQREFDLRAHA